MAAKLHVDSLSTKTSIKKLKSALDNLSTDLHVLYDEAILRVEEQNSDYRELAEKALRWVAYTYRPLQVEALQEALAIELEDLDFDVEAIQPIGLILDVCAGLLIYDEENEIVRLVHYTAQDYFDNLASSRYDDAHVLIAKECLVYLNYGVFQNSQASTDDEVSGTSDAASVGSISDASSDSQEEEYLFHLFHYATTFWAQHAMTKRDLTLGIQEVHQFLARHPRIFLQTPYRYDDDPYKPYPSPIDNCSRLKSHHGCEIAAFYGLNDELEVFCTGIEGAQAPFHYLDSSLHLAVRTGQYRATEIVLDHGAAIDNMDWWSTALHQAIELSHLDLINLLLARGADVDARDGLGETPLLLAGRNSREDCIIALLNHGADIHVKGSDGVMVLHSACDRGLLNIVNILLAHNVNADERDERGRTPLFLAVNNSHTGCIHALLDHGANLDIRNNFGRTGLHKAASNGNLNTVNILLARGAEIEVRNRSGQTPLLMAAERGHNDCILALIGSGADVNVQGDDGFTPLHLASAADSIEIKVELLKHDAAVDTRSRPMYSVKFKSNRDYLEFKLKFNLDEDCQISVCSAIGFNSTWHLERLLQYREEVLEMLFWKDGLTALDIAMLREDEEMIRTLKPLTPSTREPVKMSIEAFLLERLGVTSIEEAQEELNRRFKAERAARRAKARAEEGNSYWTDEEAEEETEEEAENQVEEEDRAERFAEEERSRLIFVAAEEEVSWSTDEGAEEEAEEEAENQVEEEAEKQEERKEKRKEKRKEERKIERKQRKRQVESW